eukprot:6758698-Pyramimonas_sp.AAC.1
MPGRESSEALLQLEISEENHHHFEQKLVDTNSFADLTRVEDRVQTSRCNRRMRLIILNRFVCAPAL